MPSSCSGFIDPSCPWLAALAAACALAAATAQASDQHRAVGADPRADSRRGAWSSCTGPSTPATRRPPTGSRSARPPRTASTTQPGTIDKKDPVAVMSVVSGLLKGGTYHARLVARNDDGLSLGADVDLHRRRGRPGRRRPGAAARQRPPRAAPSGPASDPAPGPGTPARRRSWPRPRRPSSARRSASPRRPGTRARPPARLHARRGADRRGLDPRRHDRSTRARAPSR